MSQDSVDYSPNYIASLIGGILICLATSLHLLMKGRVTGWSGIFNGLVTLDFDSLHWKSSIIAGLVSATTLAYLVYGNEPVGNQYLLDPVSTFVSGNNFWGWFFAGLLVGMGTKMANGCTSGHGVCGLPRFSRRSIVSVFLFMGAAAGMANLRHSYPFWTGNIWYDFAVNLNHQLWAEIFLAVLTVLVLLKTHTYPLKGISVNIVRNSEDRGKINEIILSYIVGFIFGLGLLYGGMMKRSTVLGFLTFDENWDASLLFVVGGAVLGNLITFHYVINVRKAPVMENSTLEIPTNNAIDLSLVIGSVLFGLGWGLAGICPGPALGAASIYLPHVLAVFIPCMGLGQHLGSKFSESLAPKKGFQEFVDIA